MPDRRGFLGQVGALLAGALSAARRGEAVTAGSPLPEWPSDSDPAYWGKLRKQWDLPVDEVFLNTATLGAMPRVVAETVSRSLLDLNATVARWDYKPGRSNWFTGYDPEDRIRGKLAALIHAEGQEVSLVQNATMGMNLVAMGLDLSPGDEVLQTDQEHPGGKCGWEVRAKRHGVVWKAVKLPVVVSDPAEIVDLVTKAITKKTKVIAWPHITSALGTVHPVKEICALARERGILSVIDGAQALGQVPVDVKAIGCDAYFGSPHKWLLAPAGNGFLFVRSETARRIWTTLASSEWDNQKDGGYRLQQRGTGSLPLLLGLEAAFDFHAKVGPARWVARVKELGDYLRHQLADVPNVVIRSSVHPALCAGITTWRLPPVAPSRLQDVLWDRYRLRPRAVEEWGLRTSTAVYNSEAEIDRLVEAVRAIAKGA